MNLRLICGRVQDSSPDVTQEISDVSSKLEELGIDFEFQDIGEPDTGYLAYLKEMMPPVQDDEDNRNAMKSDSLSGLIPQLDFYVSIESDHIDGTDVRVSEYEDEFTAFISAGEYSIVLFGLEATLELSGYLNEGMRSHDYDQPDDPDEVVITDSDLSLESIAGVFVSDGSGLPVVYFEGSVPVDDMDGFNGYAAVASGVASAERISLPQLGEYSKAVLSALDGLLESHIGKQTYISNSVL